MQVRILYFGVLKDHVGAASEDLPLPEGSSVATLLNVLQEREPSRPDVWNSIAIALNLHYLRDTTAFDAELLNDGDEIAFGGPIRM